MVKMRINYPHFLIALNYIFRYNLIYEVITMKTWEDVANLIFPEITETIEDLNKLYPERNLKEGAMVTRFAPSPTGFLHTGSLFVSLLCYTFARQSNGVFYVRLEDTDQKREIEGSGDLLINELRRFNVIPNEGYLGDKEEGTYGPYQQSKRQHIYDICIKYLISIGKAYPCFCSQEELDALREEQERNKIRPGYYGYYAKYKQISADEAYNLVESGKEYIIRFRSEGSFLNKIKVHDVIRGDLELSENDLDIVIRKKDGLPTYHFAHLVDDHFMHTTHVIRGEEWLPSLPIHIDLFKAMNWVAPSYAHVPAIMKMDNGNRRKISKRKDPEAAVSYFIDNGYPTEALLEYLFTIANSNYEEWRLENKEVPFDSFHLTFDKISKDGALFDLEKIKFLSKEYISRLSAEALNKEILTWSNKYDQELYQRINSNPSFFINILNIERNIEKPRKDYEKYSDIKDATSFFYKDEFDKLDLSSYQFDLERFDKELIKDILVKYLEVFKDEESEENWFNVVKELTVKVGFCDNVKEYKKNKEAYKGHVGDIASIIRVSLTSKTQSPNLFCIIKVIGIEEAKRRIEKVIKEL